MVLRTRKSGLRAYLKIVESYREPGRLKPRVIATPGRLDQLQWNGKLGSLSGLSHQALLIFGDSDIAGDSLVRPRFRATCYRAANWRYLGDTQGRGKCDVAHRATLPRKAVYVYPLAADFRRVLGVAA